MTKHPRHDGFTIIELLVVIVVLVILSALVALTASGVQSKNRNGDRQTDIDTLRGQLESYYAENDKYPTLANLRDSAWRTKHLPKLKDGTITDPRWHADIAACTKNGQPSVAAEPAANCYSYQVKTSSGSECDNDKNMCVHYTVTAMLEGGGKYVKSSLN
jgi:prepilin-type N-terminal cleavage/methylation domain-containing protein